MINAPILMIGVRALMRYVRLGPLHEAVHEQPSGPGNHQRAWRLTDNASYLENNIR